MVAQIWEIQIENEALSGVTEREKHLKSMVNRFTKKPEEEKKLFIKI